MAIWHDLRYTWRGLSRQPGWTLTAILTAALGIGASTAVFSVVDRLLFRPLPYRGEDRLVSVGIMAPLDANEFMFASEYFDLRHNPGPFESLTAFQAGANTCDLSEVNPVQLKCLLAEQNFLPNLGFQPAVGRVFTPNEDRPNHPPVAMISYELWQSRFAGDPHVPGRTISLDGTPTEIVGVLPRNFETPTLTHADILLPLALNEATEREGRVLRVFAWRKPEITLPQTVAQLQPYFARTLKGVPPPFRKEVHLAVRPIRDRQIGDARLAAWAWFGGVLMVLLIACTNIANLLLARASVRERERSVRLALGASRGRLAQQALTESLTLGLIGGLAGVALAWALTRGLVSVAADALPRLAEANMDSRVLLFAVAASIGAGLLFGLLPALQPAVALGGGRAMGPARSRWRSALVMAQLALSLMLLTGAGLLLESWWNLARVPLGLQSSHVLTAQFVLGRQRYSTDAQQVAFFREAERRVAAIPGVSAVAISDSLPPSGGTRSRPLVAIDLEGHPRKPEGTGGMIPWRYVTPGYFRALGIPVKQGRGFTEQDRDPGAYSIVISEALARRIYPGENPLGQHLLRSPQGQWGTVVGVVGDVKNRGPAKPGEPEYYLLRKLVPDFMSANQEPPIGWRAANIVVQTPLDASRLAAPVREALSALDPTMPVTTATMTDRLGEIEAAPRFHALLVGVFAAMGLLLAAVGLFGVMSFAVTQRSREIGVRMALGATPSSILGLTLRQAGQWTTVGAVFGLLGCLAFGRVLQTLLFQVQPLDWRVLTGAVLALGTVALLAAALPARRAARVQPMIVLREE